MHLARRGGGGWRVSYAIADVGSFVAMGGALDAEVTERGVTFYLPDDRAPLHPAVLGEGAASLLPGEDRPAALWTIDLDADGAVVSSAVARAAVRSRRRLTYAEGPALPHCGTAPERPSTELRRGREAWDGTGRCS